MQKLIMLAGPSGSGKSTYAQKLTKELIGDDCLGVFIVSSDKIRGELYGDESVQTDPQRVFDEANNRVAKVLESRATVIFDATNLVAKFRSDALNYPLRVPNVTCELHYMMTPGMLCIERNAVRHRRVPDHVIARQLNQWERDMERGLHEFWNEGFKVVKFID